MESGGHFVFWPVEKNANIFGRDIVAKFIVDGPFKSIPSSNLTSKRMVTDCHF